MNLLKHLINLLLPPRCIKCGVILSEKNGLCSECFNSINFISHPFCYKCGKPFDKEINIKDIHKTLCAKCLKEKNSLFSLQRSAFIYDDESKCLILDFKFKDKTISA